MKTLAEKSTLVAVLAGLIMPAALLAQGSGLPSGGASRGVERFTLLTGPNLLSPPTRPLNSPTIFSEKISSGTGLSHSSGFSFVSFEEREKATEAEVQNAREKLAEAERRLEQLRAERAAALKRKAELDAAFKAANDQNNVMPKGSSPASSDQIRFDAQMPALSPGLPKTPPPANSVLRPE